MCQWLFFHLYFQKEKRENGPDGDDLRANLLNHQSPFGLWITPLHTETFNYVAYGNKYVQSWAFGNDMLCCSLGWWSSLDLLTLSGKPQELVFSVLFGLMFFLLFSLEKLQVVLNGAWGEDWGYWSKGRMPWLFLYFRCAWLNVRSALEREMYKYYMEISSLQSTLPSPVQSKIGPDVFILHVKCEANLIIFWLKDFELICSLCVGSQPSVKRRVLPSDWDRKIHKCCMLIFLHYINTCFLNFLCTVT